MNKLVTLLIFIAFVSVVTALFIESSNTFSDGSTNGNVTFDEAGDIVKFISVPLYAHLRNFNFTIEGIITIVNTAIWNTSNVWWTFNDTLANVSGTVPFIANNSPDFTTGQIGNAIQFDGINQTAFVNLTTGFAENVLINLTTLEIWFRINKTPPIGETIFMFGNGVGFDDTNTMGCAVLAAGGMFCEYRNALGGNVWDIVPDNVIDPLRWYHLALSFGNNNPRTLFINGVSVNDTSGADPDPSRRLESEMMVIQIGQGITSVPQTFNGSIDNFVLYEQILTPLEIEAHYLAGLAIQTPQNFSISIGNVTTAKVFHEGGIFNYSVIVRDNNSLINNILLDSCICTNCSVSGSNCLIPITFTSNTSGIVSYDLLNINYSFGVGACTDDDYNTTLFTFRYFDQSDSSALIATNAFDLTVYDPFSQGVNGTFAGSTTDNMCSHVNRSIAVAFTGTQQVSSNTYATKINEYTTANPINFSTFFPGEVDTYLINLSLSTTITYSWFTTSYDLVDGVMEIFECVGNGSRTLIDSTPIISGSAVANINLVTTPYSYQVIVDGVRFTDPDGWTSCHFEDDATATYFVQIDDDHSQTTGMYSISCNVTKSGDNAVLMTWGSNPQNPSPITGCIFADRYSAIARTQIYINCTTAEQSIERSIPQSGFGYVAYGKLFQSGFSITCDDELEFNADTSTSDLLGLSGVMALFFFMAGMILLFSDEKPVWYPIIGGVAFVIMYLMGLLAFGWVATSSILAIVVIVLIVGRYNKKS